MKPRSHWQNLWAALGLVSFFLSASPSPAEMIFSPKPQSQSISLEFPPSANRKSPKATAGAGRRAICDYNNVNLAAGELLVALVPDRFPSQDSQGTYVSSSKTAASNPDFWFYIPKNQAKYANFTLKDPQGNAVASLKRIKLPSVPGIIRLPLPDTSALEVGGQYEWSFSLICDSRHQTKILGIIERVKLDPGVEAQIEQTGDPLAKARLYAQNYIWNETLTILAGLKESNFAEWKQLLESAALGDYGEQELLDFSPESLDKEL